MFDNSSLIVPSAFKMNACASDFVNTAASSNDLASVLSIVNPDADNCKFPSVVVTVSSGLTVNLTVLEAVNPSTVVTVNVIVNTPPVTLTLLNASN